MEPTATTYEFNDRGRGPALTETINLDDNNRLVGRTVTGNDYPKNQVSERFTVKSSRASWENASGAGSARYTGQFYHPVNPTPASSELLIQILSRRDGGEIDLLPTGTLKLVAREDHVVNGKTLVLYAIGGISYAPSYYWLDDTKQFFATVSPSRGISCIRAGFEDMKPQLVDLQVQLEDAHFQRIARRTTQNLWGKVAISNVNLFNSISGEMEPGRTVVFEQGKIVEVIDSPDPGLAPEIKVIDGMGYSLLPGFFDMHVHIDKTDGILHLAGGVTAVRDMAVQANYIEQKQKLANDFNTGILAGPRIVWMCGFIDGNGPYTRDQGIDNVEQGIENIWQFNRAGLPQIKLYSSIKPEWVKPLADAAHGHGMRVSGHIPAFMTATEAIQSGYDEIQHMNMLFLNFYGDTLDTRNMTRFSAVGENAESFNFNSEESQVFLSLLKERDIIIDPTMAIFEWGFRSVPGEPSPAFAAVLDRLPLSVQRHYYSGGFKRTPGMHQRYLNSYNKMVSMVKVLHDAGIRVVPGTDITPGFGFHRELELYVESGIPAAEVLQLATIRSAEVAKVDAYLGSIEPGKMADMVLINGNPVENISDVRNVVLTIKGELLAEVGVAGMCLMLTMATG